MSGGISSGTAALIVAGVSAAGTIGSTIASTIASSNAQRAQGNAQKTEANYQAAQLTQQAGQEAASGERAEATQQLQTNYALSNARAAAAGQGGTTTDPTAVTDMAQIATEGNYRAATALYEGQAKAQGLQNQAAGQVYQGQLQDNAAQTRANTTLISGASSLFNKYGSSFMGGLSDGGGLTGDPSQSGFFPTQAGADNAAANAGITFTG